MQVRDPLVQFLERRDQASFASLVARTRDDVLRAAFRVLGDRDAAEDVTQDVFLKCLNPPWTPDEVKSGRALLAATAVNLAKMRIRGEVRRRAREETAAERRDGGDDGLGRDEIEHVRFAVDSLPEGLRRPVELRYFGGLPLAELATALDVSLSTAKARSSISTSSRPSSPSTRVIVVETTGTHATTQVFGAQPKILDFGVARFVDHDMAIMREETFGPIVPVMAVAGSFSV